ncbi:hypothetical protein BKA57DRAFT_468589 [Linnemannia elongata]|nr:hypothetical protein BKA57DRAFT_468589 [Linnemannia elongata]
MLATFFFCLFVFARNLLGVIFPFCLILSLTHIHLYYFSPSTRHSVSSPSFRSRTHAPRILLAIDSTHIPLNQPTHCSELQLESLCLSPRKGPWMLLLIWYLL